MEDLIVFSDGGCIGNPGPGGWAAILLRKNHYEEYGGLDPSTTNNRMEMTGAIEGLKRARPGETVRVITDSRYLIDGITKWIHGWRKKGWVKSDGNAVLNRDLWETLWELAGRNKIVWEHVAGHCGHPENERCDKIANGFARGTPPELKSGDGAWITGEAVDCGQTEPYPKPVYLSVVEGSVEEHKSWAECEARIKGRKGARCRKVKSRQEELALLLEWKELE